MPFPTCNPPPTSRRCSPRRAGCKTPLRQETIRTLIGLMAVTGIRGGEVVALDDEDFDPDRGVLLVRQAKLGKHRLLPLHATTVTALQAHRQLRDRRFPRRPARRCWYPAPEPGCFTTTSARRSPCWPGRHTCPADQATAAPGRMRHSFAVATLLDWCCDGGDIASRMPLLSAYLGHASPEHTYWYYSDSRVIPILAPLRVWRACGLG